ncbi:MAG: TonB-dependent receptor [Caldimonas sp.]
MRDRTKICAAITAACGGVLMSAGPAAYAQDAAQTLDRVEITGSNIRRINSETASPVQVLSREDIAKSSRSSVAELLQTLSVDNAGSVPKSFGNGFATGGSGISLRGLGAASTLVLLNGRRLAPFGLADDGQKVFVDLNLIPLEAVERVEILKDGGSAIYGSDAIAGVVNVILRKDYQGMAANASYGQSRYHDGQEKRVALTGGYGDLQAQGFNVLANLEVGKQGGAFYRDRTDRGAIGRVDLRDLGFTAQQGFGGTGAITTNNAAGNSLNGNVRNPVTLDYYNRGNLTGVGFTRTFPAAACSNFTSHPQGDPGGGCLYDSTQSYGQVQPSQEFTNFFARGALQIAPAVQGYAEFNYYNNRSVASTTPSSVSGSVGYPGGPVSNAGVSLGAANPDNPYFGTAARLRYGAADVGPRVSHVDSDFYRVLAGVKGTIADWDYDSAFLFSQDKLTNSRTGFLQRDVAFALLNPTAANVAAATANSPAYAALPAGTYWRIAENANLNSAALYAALAPVIASHGNTKITQVDVKASRELMALGGGALGLAVGAEVRRESVSLTPHTGTERGNVIGAGYAAYEGARTVAAGYAELLAPVRKDLELSAAARYDHYSDAGSSFTPKLGIKYTPAKEIALRGTYARGFRAPSSAENGVGGIAAFSTASDPLRCGLGIAAACAQAQVALIISPNPALKPETSNNYTLGMVFEPTTKTSIALDYFAITRKNEINTEQTDAAIAAGSVARDPSTATGVPGDPGAIVAVLAKYVNSSQTKVHGFDLDAKQGFDLGGIFGKLTITGQWTHLFTFKRTETNGTFRDFVGTHGNCDTTNCAGTPADKANFGAFVDTGPFRVGANVVYRASIENRNYKGDPDCGTSYPDGSDAPAGCRIASFTTVDLVGRWLPLKNLEIYGSIRNLFDRIAPFDPFSAGTIGGAVSYNPLDTSGAMGRFYSIGVKYKFN